MKEPRDILAPLQALQLIHFAQMTGHTTPALPPELWKLIGLYMLIDKLKQLLGLVEFMKEQGGINGTGQIDEVSNTLKEAISQNKPGLFVQIYNTAFATVTELIAGSETKLLPAAAEAGNRLAVAQLLEIKGIDVNAKDKYGYTTLMLAAYNGHEGVATQLLNVSAIQVNAKDNFSKTALTWAAMKGHEAVVAQLVAKGSNVNAAANNGWTALMYAAENKHEAVVYILWLKQLFDASSDATDATLLGLNAEIREVESLMTITPLSLCDHLLASLEKLPTQDEKTALLNKALSNNNAFSGLMRQASNIELKQRLQTELDKLNTPSVPVIFSTAAPTEPRVVKKVTFLFC